MAYPPSPQISGCHDEALTNMSVSLGEPYTAKGSPQTTSDLGTHITSDLGPGVPYRAYTGLLTVSVGALGSYH